MSRKRTMLAAATVCAGLMFSVDGNAADTQRTLDLNALKERERTIVAAPGADELQQAEDMIGFAADWAMEADLQDRFGRSAAAWRKLVARHEGELERIRERNRKGAAFLAWASWLELTSQLITFADALGAERSDRIAPETGAALELCAEGQCEPLPVDQLLEQAAPGAGTQIDMRQFKQIQDRLLQTLPSLGLVRCDMAQGRCWSPGRTGEAEIRHPASLALLGHAARVAGRTWRGTAHYGRYASTAAARHWSQWRNIYVHWRKHSQQFPGNPSIMQYARDMGSFLKTPPKGTRMAVRENGERMFYHAASDRFGVIGRNGFLKTYYRPGGGVAKDGLRYWRGQLRQWKATERIVR